MHDIDQIKFGTDGWRGIIADTYTFSNVRIVAQAVADYLGKGKRAAVAYDTRFLSDRFARASAEVLANNGIEVILSDKPVPTPTLSFTVKSRNLDLGVMITASHNPGEYNGFKIKTSSGGAAGQEVTRCIESLLGKTPVKEGSKDVALIHQQDMIKDYARFIRSYIDLKRIKKKKFKVLVDAMYGAGDSYISDILKGTHIELEFLRNTINPSFDGTHPEPIEENLHTLLEMMKKKKFDLGMKEFD